MELKIIRRTHALDGRASTSTLKLTDRDGILVLGKLAHGSTWQPASEYDAEMLRDWLEEKFQLKPRKISR